MRMSNRILLVVIAIPAMIAAYYFAYELSKQEASEKLAQEEAAKDQAFLHRFAGETERWEKEKLPSLPNDPARTGHLATMIAGAKLDLTGAHFATPIERTTYRWTGEKPILFSVERDGSLNWKGRTLPWMQNPKPHLPDSWREDGGIYRSLSLEEVAAGGDAFSIFVYLDHDGVYWLKETPSSKELLKSTLYRIEGVRVPMR